MARRSPARSAPSSVSTPQSSYCGSVPHAPARSQRIRRRVIVCDLTWAEHSSAGEAIGGTTERVARCMLVIAA